MSNSNDLIRQILAWIDTNTWDDSYAYLTSHPGLLDDLTGQILRAIHSQAGSEAEARTLTNHLVLWTACRQEGIGDAYQRLVGFRPQPGEDIEALIAKMQSLDRLPDTAHERVAICQQALQHLSKERDETTWALFQSEYGLALSQDLESQIDYTVRLEDAIAALHAALSVFTRQTNAAEWAIAQANLANTYLMRIAGDFQENHEQAIHHAWQALFVLEAPEQHIPAEQIPVFRAHLELLRHLARRHLGVALLKTEQYATAIEVLQPGLAYFSKTETLPQWIEIRYRLGDAHYHCQQGNRVSHLQQAIACLEEVLPHLNQSQFATQRGRSHHLLGLAYGEYHVGNRAYHVEQAIEHLKTAVTHYEAEQDRANWASVHADLGLLYSERFTENRRQSLEDAIQSLEVGLSILTPEKYPDNWYKINNNLGNAYIQRIVGDRRDNIEKAISYFEQALEAIKLPEQALAWGMLKSHLAFAYTERIAGERPDNIERAITYCQEALQVLIPQTREWASTHNNVALAWGRRILGDPESNKQQSIYHSEQALTVYTREVDALRWAQNKLNLGTMYYELAQLTEAPWLTEKAITEMEAAMDAYPRPQYNERWAMAATNLGMIYSDRVFGIPADNMQRAIDLLEAVLPVYTHTAYPERWARTHLNLGTAYARLADLQDGDAFSLAITHFKDAISVLNAAQYPHEYQQLARNLGNTYFEQEDWAEAAVWYREYVAISRTLFDTAYSEGGRLAAATAVSDIYSYYAYAHIQLGQYDVALEVLEAGKAQLLADAFNQTEYLLTKLPDEQRELVLTARQQVHAWETAVYTAENVPVEHRQALANARHALKTALEAASTTHPELFPQPLTAAAIRQLPPPHSSILIPLLTNRGSYLFFIPHGQTELTTEHIIPLVIDPHTLAYWLMGDEEQPGWLLAYRNKGRDTATWLDAVESVTTEIWDAFFSPLSDLLSTYEIERLIFIPQSGLQLLPLHAAWVEQAERKRYLIDNYIVQTVPSCQVLAQVGRRRTSLDRNARLLAVADPNNNLPFATEEVATITTQFTAPQTLHHEEARQDVLLAVDSPHIFHFAGHGTYDWEDVQQSGLVCADAILTLHTMQRRLPLQNTQLVVLSACETGLIDLTHSPDEYMGLPFAFLSAGVAGVVTSLWAVNDLSTMLLMEQFYHHLCQNQEAPLALRQAQLWLREVTAGELAKRFGEVRLQLKANRLTLAEASTYWLRFAGEEPESKPFAHPHFWAAFTFTGA